MSPLNPVHVPPAKLTPEEERIEYKRLLKERQRKIMGLQEHQPEKTEAEQANFVYAAEMAQTRKPDPNKIRAQHFLDDIAGR